MKIYIDGWFISLMTQPYTFFDDVTTIPNDCDIIGITFYNNYFKEHTKVIHKLSQKTKQLIVNVSEPTLPLRQFLKNNQLHNVQLFGDAVLNYNEPNWNTIVSWFIGPENFYATKPWAQSLLQQLTPWRHKQATHKFDALLGKAKANRDWLYNACQTSNYREQILLSYYGKLPSLDKMILPRDIGPIDFFHNTTYQGNTVNLAWMLPVDVYNNSWYSIVAETTHMNEHSQYTEKVGKPMVAGRPFVAFAGQHYLQNLRSLGFKTFADVIDESYDSVADFDQRMTQAWQQVEWLCTQDPHQVYRALEPILEHNRRHFIETDWHAAIRKYL